MPAARHTATIIQISGSSRNWLTLLLLPMIAVMVRADDAEFKGVQFVENMGGTVKRGDEISGQPVVEADLYNTKVADADLEKLSGLARLKVLDLSFTKITDKGLKELAPLGDLETLSLRGTNITDAGLKELALFQKLHTLDLHDAKITEAGLKALAACKNLRCLYLNGQVSPQAMDGLQEALPKCKIIRPTT